MRAQRASGEGEWDHYLCSFRRVFHKNILGVLIFCCSVYIRYDFPQCLLKVSPKSLYTTSKNNCAIKNSAISHINLPLVIPQDRYGIIRQNDGSQRWFRNYTYTSQQHWGFFHWQKTFPRSRRSLFRAHEPKTQFSRRHRASPASEFQRTGLQTRVSGEDMEWLYQRPFVMIEPHKCIGNWKIGGWKEIGVKCFSWHGWSLWAGWCWRPGRLDELLL